MDGSLFHSEKKGWSGPKSVDWITGFLGGGSDRRTYDPYVSVESLRCPRRGSDVGQTPVEHKTGEIRNKTKI